MTAFDIALYRPWIGQAEIEAVTDVLRSGWLSAGPVTEEFEGKYAAALGVESAVAVSSGTAALHLAVLALGLGPGDEVVLPSLNFVSAAATVALCGATRTKDGRFPPLNAVALGEMFDLLDELTRAVRADAPWLTPDAGRLDTMTAAEWASRNLTHPDARLFFPEDRPDALATPLLAFWAELAKAS